MSKKDQAPAPEQTGNGAVYSEPITLDQPVKRGDTKIDTIRLRKPRSGELRGLNYIELAQCGVDEVLAILPRITEPPLTVDDVEDLDPADSLAMAGAVRRFFMTKAEIASAEAMIAAQT